MLADALGIGFDAYLRLAVGPGSLSVIRYGPDGATVVRLNDTGSDPTDLVPTKKKVRSARSPSADGRSGRPAKMS